MIQQIKNWYHLVQAVLAALWYRFPSRSLRVIGVTGTDGKTTTTHLLYHLLTKAGKRVSMISTVYARVGAREYDTGLHVTTPHSFLIQRMLRAAADHGDEFFILETTSHALDQYRTWGIHFELGIITNITHEHLDYHRSIEEYARTKFRLARQSSCVILNADDEQSMQHQNEVPRGVRIIWASLSDQTKADVVKDFALLIPDIAEFNKSNFLMGYAAAGYLGLPEATTVDAIRHFELPAGRMDTVYAGTFKVIVDFAHTPNALTRLLQTIHRETKQTNGRILHVFGSAGLRDKLKRPLMGAVSARYASVVVLTEEDYRTEDPHTICAEIQSGMGEYGGSVEIITDRYQAIKRACEQAKQGDVVVITGKGHEKSLCRGTTEYPWDDRESVLRIVHAS